MKSQLIPRRVTENEWTWTILGLAVLFGSVVRFFPGFLSKFPINDGGMFAVMIRDLQINHFIPPVFTTYNFSEIPYAYPPLGFYLGGLFEWLGWSEFQVLIWLPAFLSIVIISLYYFLALELLKNRPHAALATAFFALVPGNYIWYLMGGGLTRALGAVFFILSLTFFHRAIRQTHGYLIVLTIIFCSLTVLSHPQYAFLAVMGCGVFWLFNKPSRHSTWCAVLVVLGTASLTMPWWGIVLHRYGIGVFLSAMQSGDLQVSFSKLLIILFSRHTILPFATLFWLMGLFWAFYKGRFDLLVWGFLPYLVDQRSAPITSSFLYPMLAAYGFLNVIPALLDWIQVKRNLPLPAEELVNRRGLTISLLGILFYLFIECFFYSYIVYTVTLSADSRNMMTWVRENTPQDARFLILTGREDVMTDPVQEWFPALAERHSVTTLQGFEWILQGEFNEHLEQLAILQNCRDMDCFDSSIRNADIKYSYTIVDVRKIPLDMFLSRGYSVIFNNGWYVILLN